MPTEHKRRLTDLAVFGAAPAFAVPVHVGRPNLPDRKRLTEAVDRILDRNILTNDGPEVRALEDRFRELAGVREAVAVCNATIGLQVLAQALRLKGRILLPAFTFIATAHAFRWLGLEPVFCEIDPATHNLDPDEVRRHLDRGVAAVVGVHVWGRLCAPLALERLCREAGVPLLFDAAHALGCAGHGRSAGSFGTAEVFSLHATKVCHSFEGGVITCQDPVLAERLRCIRNLGFVGYDRVDCLGTNAKMTEVAAAAGLLSLECLDRYRDENRFRAERYRANLRRIPDLRWADPLLSEQSNHHYVAAELGPAWTDSARDVLITALHAEGVLARRYFHPGCHRMEPYRSERPASAPELPRTEALCARVFCLPNGTAVEPEAVDRICALIELILSDLPAVERQLQRRTA